MFLNTNASGSGLLGQVGPSAYGNAHAGLTGVYNAAGSTVGYGVFGISSTGFGIYGKSTSAKYGGVYGTAFNVGVEGVSTGRHGVFGQTSASGNVSEDSYYPADSSTYYGHAGVAGNDASAFPASGDVDENTGVFGETQWGLAGVLGVLAQSAYGATAGVVGVNFGSQESGVAGRDESGDSNSNGLFGASRNGTGVYTFSNGGEGINVYSGADVGIEVDNATLNSIPALLVQGGNTASSIPIVIVRNNYGGAGSANDVFSIGSDGSVIASGSITGSSSPLVVTRGSGGQRYVAYGERTSAPTIDDVGFGTVTAGSANVRLDPTFASTIDPHAPYAVFLSPEGENHGLYVTAKTPTSFAVREMYGGKSTLAFSYRIVARPLDMPLAAHLPDASTLARPVFDDRKVRARDARFAADRKRYSRAFAKKPQTPVASADLP